MYSVRDSMMLRVLNLPVLELTLRCRLKGRYLINMKRYSFRRINFSEILNVPNRVQLITM